MKITSNGIERYKNAKLPQNDMKEKPVPAKAVKTDTVAFKSGDIKTGEQFIESIKTQILNEVKMGADIHKLDDLKKQIALGEYDVNPSDIIHKMMIE